LPISFPSILSIIRVPVCLNWIIKDRHLIGITGHLSNEMG